MSQFHADSSLVAEVVPSPNHSERRDGRAPDMILLHYTGMLSAQAALERLSSPNSKVSAHYLVYEDGHIIQMVQEGRRAWHAGVSYWAGETDINSCSIGIEIVNPGHEFGYQDFPKRQMAALATLCRGILTRHRVRADRVLGHSDVAPARKKDPGEKFPWKTLHDSGVGLWVPPVPIIEGGTPFALGDHGDDVAAIQKALAEYGYGIDADGNFDSLTHDVVAAFQRHFRPERIDGITDASTVETLKAVIEARDKLAA